MHFGHALRVLLITTSGLFGLNEKTAKLEVVIVYFQNFIPDTVRRFTLIIMFDLH